MRSLSRQQNPALSRLLPKVLFLEKILNFSFTNAQIPSCWEKTQNQKLAGKTDLYRRGRHSSACGHTVLPLCDADLTDDVQFPAGSDCVLKGC